MPSRLAAEIGEDDLEIAAELPQDLTARAARWCRCVGIGNHSDAAELPMALGDRLEHRDALGTDRQSVGRVLDVASGDDRPVGGLERSPDLEARVACVRVATCA